ncbi:hypothetical protein JMN32_19515 [Fulvivirga sp. 29W222]|uniref:Uncharacterized protein n=1 Tax=Fulvivirga marina TaxID=2494733 RepID=A0A937G1U4_9BACT|nr:hypothetical protein [Fulvivirga marina]MBL6448508.1 hypothetical protein [Fulvivirga marina]
MNIKDLIPKLLKDDDKKVCDKTLSTELISEGGASPSLSLPGENFLFSAKVEGAFSVNLFNDTNDHSVESKIFEHWPEAKSLYTNQALLGYSLEGRVKANASAENLGKFELGINAEQSFKAKSFRIHDCDTTVKDAFTGDVTSFKFIFKKDDVTSLKVNEAMAFEAAGKLSLNAGIKVTDVYSGTASMVSGLLNLSGQVDLKLDASASVDFKIEIEDDFSVVIIRQAEDKFKVCINKIIKRTKELKAKAGIEAALGDNDKLKDLVNKFFEGVDEELFKYINEKIDTTGLKEEDLEKVLKAASLLKLTDISSVDDFREQYEQKKEKVKEKLLEVITNKVAVGISYEYSNIKTNESVFSGVFSKNAMNQFHGDIVKLKVGDLIDAYQKDPSSYNLTSYLQRKTTEITSSFGLNVAFGNFKLTSSIQREFKEVTEKKFLTDGGFAFKVDAYNRKSTRSYKHGKNSDVYILNMDASMPVFVAKEEDLTVEKFDFAFGLSFDMKENKTSDKELRDIVDWAVTWDIVPQEKSAEVINKIKTEVLNKGASEVTYHCFLKVPQGEFEELIPYFKPSLQTLIPGALAASMLQVDYADIPDFRVRNNIELRRKHYTAFWANYLNSYALNQADVMLSLVKKDLSEYFDTQNFPELSLYESGLGNYEAYNTSRTTEILNFNDVGIMVNRLTGFYDDLSKAINTRVHYEKKIFTKSIKGIDKTKFLKDFNLRFMGRLILDMNQQLADPIEIEKGFNITYKEGGKEKTLVIA